MNSGNNIHNSIAMSENGPVVAVIVHTGNQHTVKLFEFLDNDDTKYFYRGSIAEPDGYDAHEVAVSGDGNVVAYTDTKGFPQVKKLIKINVNDENDVHVFESMGSLDEDVLGTTSFGFNGNVALSYDGKTIAIRDPSSVCKVLSYQGSEKGWKLEHTTPKGEEDKGIIIYHNMVSIASDGKPVAIGDEYDDDARGRIRMYSFDENSGWTKRMGDIMGISAEDRLYLPALSKDGTYLVGVAPGAIYVNVDKKEGSNYVLKQICKPTESNLFGISVGISTVGISKDGSTVVFGDSDAYESRGAVY